MNVPVAAKELEASAGRAEGRTRWRTEAIHVVMRAVCLAASVTAMSVMLTAHQAGIASIYGFQFRIYSQWSYSHSYQYLVAVSAATTAYSSLQLVISSSRLLRNSPVISSTYLAWLIFAADQVFAYLMVSAGSAASGVTNLNRTGIRHTPLPNFCKSLRSFCDHVAVSVLFTFASSFLLASSAVLDVIWLSRN